MKTFGFIAIASLALISCGGNSSNNAEENTDSLQNIIDSQDSLLQARNNDTEEPEQSEPVNMPSFSQVIKIIDEAWQKKLPDSNPLLQEYGLTCLKYFEEQDGEIPCSDSFYGRNAVVKTTKNSDGWNEYKVEATGEHAIVICMYLSSDNYEEIYFSDKADYDNFLNQITSDYNEFEGQGLKNGMYVVSGHLS